MITPHSFEDDWKIMQTNPENDKFHLVSIDDIPEEKFDGIRSNHQAFVGTLRRGVENFHSGNHKIYNNCLLVSSKYLVVAM